MSGEITGIILNWKRPFNVAQIVGGWQTSSLVAEAIVWNNNPATTFHHDWATVVNTNQDLGLYARFAAACLARYDCILIQDDDLEIPVHSLGALYDAWRQDPAVLHGIFGRRPKADGSYDPRDVGGGEAPVVLTRVLLASRRYASAFFDVATNFEAIQRDARPLGNGEDILFSYTAMGASGRLNRVHRLPITELPAPHPIHGRNWSGHLAHRSRLLRAADHWLKGGSPGALVCRRLAQHSWTVLVRLHCPRYDGTKYSAHADLVHKQFIASIRRSSVSLIAG